MGPKVILYAIAAEHSRCDCFLLMPGWKRQKSFASKWWGYRKLCYICRLKVTEVALMMFWLLDK